MESMENVWNQARACAVVGAAPDGDAAAGGAGAAAPAVLGGVAAGAGPGALVRRTGGTYVMRLTVEEVAIRYVGARRRRAPTGRASRRRPT